MKQRKTPRPGLGGRRIAGRAQQDGLTDPYQKTAKPRDGALCRKCGAIYRAGRWSWGPHPQDGREALCPACRRIQEALPAGIVRIRGESVRRDKAAMISLARHQESAEKQEHPLNRIISIAEDPEGLIVSTTDIHLPRRIGEALARAYHGRLDLHFDEDAYFVRVDWSDA